MYPSGVEYIFNYNEEKAITFCLDFPPAAANWVSILTYSTGDFVCDLFGQRNLCFHAKPKRERESAKETEREGK